MEKQNKEWGRYHILGGVAINEMARYLNEKVPDDYRVIDIMISMVSVVKRGNEIKLFEPSNLVNNQKPYQVAFGYPVLEKIN